MLTHPGEKPHQCDVCKKSFAQPSDLKSHKRVHTGEKAYSCDVCDKKFKRLNTLQRHYLRTHWRETLTVW